MKSVLISIKPKWCELIASCKKTIEVRKTRPKLETPFKCYIYCTKDKGISFWTGKRYAYADDRSHNLFDVCGNGKVIGEFVCRNMTCIQADIDSQGEKHLYNTAFIESRMCLTAEELFNYIYDGRRNIGWGWGISDLVIYDKPKELSEFYKYCGDNPDCYSCNVYCYSNTEYGLEDYCCSKIDGCRPVNRPPQSWCYVEEPEE